MDFGSQKLSALYITIRREVLLIMFKSQVVTLSCDVYGWGTNTGAIWRFRLEVIIDGIRKIRV